MYFFLLHQTEKEILLEFSNKFWNSRLGWLCSKLHFCILCSQTADRFSRILFTSSISRKTWNIVSAFIRIPAFHSVNPPQAQVSKHLILSVWLQFFRLLPNLPFVLIFFKSSESSQDGSLAQQDRTARSWQGPLGRSALFSYFSPLACMKSIGGGRHPSTRLEAIINQLAYRAEDIRGGGGISI